MALLFLDSFDHYATADAAGKYPNITGSCSISAGSGRRSSASTALLNGRITPTLPVAPSGNVAILGVACRPGSLGGTEFYGTQILSGVTAQITLSLSTTGFLKVWRGNVGDTLLGTASSPLSASGFQFIELKATIHPSAGTITLRINEAVVLTLTGVNTAMTGSAGWNGVSLGVLSASVQFNYDDFYVLDGSGSAPLNDFLGDCRVDARLPTAEGASSAWTPLSGTDNALMVDDPTPDGDATYNSTTTVGATDTHVVQDAPVPGAVLFGVQLVLNQKKSDAGTCSVAPVVRHSGVDYPATDVNPGTAYGFAIQPYSLNPGTGAAWTEAGFNAAEFGYKRTA